VDTLIMIITRLTANKNGSMMYQNVLLLTIASDHAGLSSICYRHMRDTNCQSAEP